MMAELPLLKRTFSRLRGKDRTRRKTTEGKLETVTQNSSSSSSSSLPLATSGWDSNPRTSPPRTTHITVAKKQQWARQASVGRGGGADPPRNNPHTPPSPPDTPCPADTHPGWERGSGNTQAAPTGPQQAWIHQRVYSKTEELDRNRLDSEQHSALCLTTSGTAAPHDANTPTGDRQGAYLQSLDRSSRAWVLSSGKAQAPDPASSVSSRPPGEHNIWYNPIPEEDDRREEQSVWKRRRDQEVGGATGEDCPMAAPQRGPGGGATADCPIRVGPKDRHGNDSPKGGASPDMKHRPPDDIITPEHTDPLQPEAPPPDSSPASQKKGGVSSSVIDRLRSPRLSLKMKKLPELRRRLSLRSHRHGNKEQAKDQSEHTSSSSNQNVISRYHLDSSAPPVRPLRRSSRGRSRSAGKGGYLSDGDSPELLPRQRQQAPPPCDDVTSCRLYGGCDVTSFRLYVGSEQPRCNKRVSGLMTVHLVGLEDMVHRADRQVFVAIQIDGVTRARTALLPLRGSALSLNHAFHLELERAKMLRLIVLTPVSPQGVGGVTAPSTNQSQTSSSAGPIRNRVCGLGGVCIPPLFKGVRGQQLCVKLEPRGLMYVKLSLQEQWTPPTILTNQPSSVFGVELHLLVEREGSSSAVPILIQKTVEEIERRGLKVVGLYRLCGSAAVKKELRDWFERNSAAVSLSEELYPDINVVTGILKDYLRELPSPLITQTLYQVVLEAMTLRPPVTSVTFDPELSRSTVALLDCLPRPEKATLSLLLDHLSLVSSLSHVNRMTNQNLAVCFGPVLLWGGGANQPASQSASEGGVATASAVDFKRHIEALHYLLQLWPVPSRRPAPPSPSPPPSPPPPPLIGQQQRRAVLRLALPAPPPPEGEESEGSQSVVSRRGRGLLRPARLDSSPPINRYAGDWSVCGRDFLSGQEADYDEVAGSESEGGSEEEDQDSVDHKKKGSWSYMDQDSLAQKKEGSWSSYVDQDSLAQKKEGSWSSYVDHEFLDFDAPFSCRLSLKDFDNLIHDLDRELLNICL